MSDTITGYECTAHDFTCKGKAAAQIHMDLNRGCNLMPVRGERIAEPAEATRMHEGAHWEHDCDRCIYLGTQPGSGREWDLYWCPPVPIYPRGNLIARHGIMGDYVSGIDWIDREPMLAIAAILAMRAGHLSPSVIV